MTYEEALKKFGLPAAQIHGDEIRSLLANEIQRERDGEAGEEMLRTLCVQLFSLGHVDDALLIWDAKQSSFDASCGLDIQFVCGAGLEPTKNFLAHCAAPPATAALEYLRECEATGDFEEWTPQKTLSDYQRYFGLN